MGLHIFSLLVVSIGVWRIQFPSANPVKKETSCSLEKVEDSLSTALRLIKFVRDNEHSSSFSTADQQTITDEEGEVDSPFTSVGLVETNSTGHCKLRPANCAEIQILGNRKSGVYEIYPKWNPSAKGYKVYCDMTTEGGGWTVVQRRMLQEPQELFNRTWAEYKGGFGDLQKEFWIGNTWLNLLTTQDQIILRIEMEDWDGMKRYAHYKGFIVHDEESAFKMVYTEYYDSTAGGDNLKPTSNVGFVTIDKDNSQKIAIKFLGGFWWPNIAEANMQCNLNGVFYPKGKHLNVKDGIFWTSWKGRTYSLKKVEMKLKPLYYNPEQPFISTLTPVFVPL